MPSSPSRSFPRRFVWGVATAAPQIEGAAFTDGKGESVWDRFARQPGRVRDGHTLDVACDHYHRYREDIALMKQLGVRHYRLSLAWPRFFPDGDRPANPLALDYYRRLLDALHDAGIEPWVTLFHWDLPQALEDRGGWRVRGTVEAFARYADHAVAALSDRVRRWVTVNEPSMFSLVAYGGGDKAPGANEPRVVVNRTCHHALLAHGHGVRAVREHGARGAQVGLVDNCAVAIPLTETPRDIAAARAWFAKNNSQILAPVLTGRYPAEFLRRCGADRPQVARGDLALLSAPTDFLGLNIYTGNFIRAGARGKPEVLPLPGSYPKTDLPWLHLAPQALYWGPKFAADVYGVKSIHITENGCGYEEADPNERGEVLDLHRREYLRGYLGELQRAIADGVPVDGYFLWSYLDNFEWQDGYHGRFGIIHTDFKTLKRTPKLSARWYAEVMRANRVV